MALRGSERTNVDIAITVTTVLDCVGATIVNLSEGGAMIAGVSAPQHSRVLIDYRGQTIFGTVMWTEDDRFGVRFPLMLNEGPLFQALETARAGQMMPEPFQARPAGRPMFGRRVAG